MRVVEVGSVRKLENIRFSYFSTEVNCERSLINSQNLDK